MQIPDLSLSKQIYEELKFWGLAVVALWTIFKMYVWVKEIKDNHLTHIQEGVTNFNQTLDSSLEKQTQKIISASQNNTEELKGMRGDIQGLTNAILIKK